MLWDAAVIGGGPAGLAAGISLARAGYSTVLLEKETVGGRAGRLDWIENYPGFPDGIRGRDLARLLVRQGLRWGLSFRKARARRIGRADGVFEVSLAGRAPVRARAVVRCTGARFKPLGAPGEKRLRGRGVWNTSLGLAGRLARRDVAVVGGGETALHQAIELSRFAARVYLLTRTERLKAHPLLIRRVSERGNIVRVPRCSVERLDGRSALKRAWIREGDSAALRRLDVDGLFVLVGQDPEPLECERAEGVFIAGDARGDRFRQAAVAAGDGIKAAMECAAFLDADSAGRERDGRA